MNLPAKEHQLTLFNSPTDRLREQARRYLALDFTDPAARTLLAEMADTLVDDINPPRRAYMALNSRLNATFGNGLASDFEQAKFELVFEAILKQLPKAEISQTQALDTDFLSALIERKFKLYKARKVQSQQNKTSKNSGNQAADYFNQAAVILAHWLQNSPDQYDLIFEEAGHQYRDFNIGKSEQLDLMVRTLCQLIEQESVQPRSGDIEPSKHDRIADIASAYTSSEFSEKVINKHRIKLGQWVRRQLNKLFDPID